MNTEERERVRHLEGRTYVYIRATKERRVYVPLTRAKAQKKKKGKEDGEKEWRNDLTEGEDHNKYLALFFQLNKGKNVIHRQEHHVSNVTNSTYYFSRIKENLTLFLRDSFF